MTLYWPWVHPSLPVYHAASYDATSEVPRRYQEAVRRPQTLYLALYLAM